MKLCLIAIEDGRGLVHEQAWASLREMLPVTPDAVVRIDDRDHKLGFDGAVREAWRQARDTRCDYVFHAELDFTYNQPIPLEPMIHVLDANACLSQMSLLRQPVNHEERAAGGIVQLNPDQYEERTDGIHVWTETTRFSFTTNPSVYHAGMCGLPWPDAPESEGKFSGLLRELGFRTGIWGGKWDAPRVHHIGDERAQGATGY